MIRRMLTGRRVIPVILCLQVIPLHMFPPSSFRLTSQEWWLPALLTVLLAAGLFQVLVRRTPAMWPWHLMGFAQGLNIISRLMMVMPHASVEVNGVQRLNTAYVLLAVGSLLLSAIEIWYCELPEVRAGLAPRTPSKSAA